jgi:cadmium resistance protein CadD (predicted permease)
MTGEMIGFFAAILVCSVPLAVIYAFYRVRQLKSQERLAAIEKGVSVPIDAELPHPARSRRAGILLITGGLGFSLAFFLISRMEPDAMTAAALGVIPISIGVGYFIDSTLARRDFQHSA